MCKSTRNPCSKAACAADLQDNIVLVSGIAAYYSSIGTYNLSFSTLPVCVSDLTGRFDDKTWPGSACVFVDKLQLTSSSVTLR